LVKRLKNALKGLKPWFSEANLNKVVRYLTLPESLGPTLLEINEKIYDGIVNLSYAVDQGLDGNTLKFIDWDNSQA